MGPLSKDCGRILGVFYDYRYGLLLSDAYLGLYAVNVTSGQYYGLDLHCIQRFS